MSTQTPTDTCPHCGGANYSTVHSCHWCGSWLRHGPAYVQPRPYSCGLCGSHLPPQIVQKMKPVGWVVLVLGLGFCFVGALLSLLCIEERRVCPACGGAVG